MTGGTPMTQETPHVDYSCFDQYLVLMSTISVIHHLPENKAKNRARLRLKQCAGTDDVKARSQDFSPGHHGHALPGWSCQTCEIEGMVLNGHVGQRWESRETLWEMRFAKSLIWILDNFLAGWWFQPL